jgi:hypothetical protein
VAAFRQHVATRAVVANEHIVAVPFRSPTTRSSQTAAAVTGGVPDCRDAYLSSEAGRPTVMVRRSIAHAGLDEA